MIKRLAKKALSPLLSPLRPGNAVMFHIGRCGSTVVGQLLGRHSRIHWDGELYASILREWQRNNAGIEAVGEMPQDAVDILRRNMKLALHRFYGFEIKPFHFGLIGYSPESFLQHVDSLGFSHFILLDRENRLRKIISSIIAHQNEGRYHIEAKTKARLTRVHINMHDVRIDFDAKPLVDYLSDYDRQIQMLEALLGGRRLLRLTYEQDVQADPRRAYSRICEFLGLHPENAPIRLSRTNPFPLRDMVENIEELREALCGTPYEWMLDDLI